MPSKEYERKKATAKARAARVIAAGQDIGPIPPPKNWQRRNRADNDFRFFCETYLSKLFSLRWSPDHLKIIAKIERAVIHGGLFSVAMPRGSGKTTLSQAAVKWAILTGHQSFCFLIAGTADEANVGLENIKTHLLTNDLLLEDYPEAILPIRKIEGEARRCLGQRYYGELTHIEWSADQIVMASIPGSRCAGAIIRTSGLLGSIRGAMYVRPDGKSVRPSLVLIDDPQTDQSARSPSQTEERLAVINGAILNLAGPSKRIAAVMPCTVIRPNDLSDRLLNRNEHPEWQGERTKMVYAFPANEELWKEYAQIRHDEMQNDGDGKISTAFYKERRAAMDAGAVVPWSDRFGVGELSAIQHAMNLRLRDEAAFWAEYQNEPLLAVGPEASGITSETVLGKIGGIPRGRCATGVNHVTAFVDVQACYLAWIVVGWTDNFGGAVLDYGTYPDQGRLYFTKLDAKNTLRHVHKSPSLDAAIYSGLTVLSDLLLTRDWKRDDGAVLKIEKMPIDANWPESTEAVYQFCRQSRHAAIVIPSRGRYVGAASTPFSDYVRRPNERLGHYWRMPVAQGRPIRQLVFDANYWKTFVQTRIALPLGDPATLSIFAEDRKGQHQLIADQWSSEYPERVTHEKSGRQVDEWKTKPNRDNELWDCVVGAAVAASVAGVSPLPNVRAVTARKRVRLSELQQKRRVWSPKTTPSR